MMRKSSSPAPGGRTVFIDSLRVFLTLLVVAHHAIITYSGTGGWYYIEGRQDTLTVVVSGIFCGVNQAYFMSFFFMISAYFTVASVDRKGAGAFLRDRLIRLGVPIVAFDILVHPLLLWTLASRFRGYAGGFGGYLLDYLNDYARLRAQYGTGPLWFLLALLIFTTAYLAVRAFGRGRGAASDRAPAVPGAAATAAFIIGCGLIAFAVRLWMPVGESPRGLNLQIAYFPLYIGCFAAGIIAWRGQWFAKYPESASKRWGYAAAFMVALMPVVLIAGGALDGREALFLGGPYWQALAYAAWEPVMCVSMIAWLTGLFRKRFGGGGQVMRFLSQNAYAIYIVHAPVLVFLGLALRPLGWHPLMKFTLLFALAVPVCSVLAVVLRALPGARRVL